MRVFRALAAVALAQCAGAAEVSLVEVEKNDGVYSLRANILVNASRERVFDVLTDYDNFERLASVFEESRFLSRDEDGGGVVYTRMNDCVLFFCQRIERVENMEVEAPNLIVTTVVPERSDVTSGVSRWELIEQGKGTLIRHSMEIEPGFWVPPVIGPIILKRYLKKSGTRAAERVEFYASEDHKSDVDSAY